MQPHWIQQNDPVTKQLRKLRTSVSQASQVLRTFELRPEAKKEKTGSAGLEIKLPGQAAASVAKRETKAPAGLEVKASEQTAASVAMKETKVPAGPVASSLPKGTVSVAKKETKAPDEYATQVQPRKTVLLEVCQRMSAPVLPEGFCQEVNWPVAVFYSAEVFWIGAIICQVEVPWPAARIYQGVVSSLTAAWMSFLSFPWTSEMNQQQVLKRYFPDFENYFPLWKELVTYDLSKKLYGSKMSKRAL